MDEAALDRLQALREKLGKPFVVRSAYRSPEHNRAVGGAKRSKHMEGIAFDIAMSDHDPAAFEAAAREAGFLGFGFYPRSDFIHIDLGPKREWGERFAPRPAFARETPPARERLAESRTIRGGGVAGVATVGAAGIEVAQEALAWAQDAVLTSWLAGCATGSSEPTVAVCPPVADYSAEFQARAADKLALLSAQSRFSRCSATMP